ncbi:MAG: cobalamin B12-binding domain-containing protein [Erythrobacter sp.]|nr:cobalamin B12-binding domain-containing protein [Erythrobacter sp.]NCQ63199.1 cobalamin B12-binding domain-containing protein [Alphaproteobacteria bacterium]
MIPRLMLAHAREPNVAEDGDPPSIGEDLAESFAVHLLQWDADRALAEVEDLLSRGHDIQSLFLELLAPAARKLGTMWEEDECEFIDVTMGLWRLQEVMREIAARVPPVIRSLRAPARALFSPMPGDQHGFGALMIDEVFARAGWESEVLIDPQQRELLAVTSQKSFDLLGLTITNDSPTSAIQSLIRAIRTVSANPALRIMIGGRLINANPGMAEEVGADGTATDAFAALECAERMVAETGLHLKIAT